jgi:hypothetical protein
MVCDQRIKRIYGVEEERVVSDCEEEKSPGGSMWEVGAGMRSEDQENIQVEKRGKA